MAIPKLYKRVARMSGPELWAAYSNPQVPAILLGNGLHPCMPGYIPDVVTITSLVAVEVEERILASKPFNSPLTTKTGDDDAG